jgi:hypothetical protein
MTQAMELLHSQSVDEALAPLSGNPLHGIDDDCKPFLTSVNGNLTFPSNKALIERATKLSSFPPASTSGRREDVPPVLQHPIDEAMQKVETEHTRPGKAIEIDAKVRS